jgi:hypothetical protein
MYDEVFRSENDLIKLSNIEFNFIVETSINTVDKQIIDPGLFIDYINYIFKIKLFLILVFNYSKIYLF